MLAASTLSRQPSNNFLVVCFQTPKRLGSKRLRLVFKANGGTRNWIHEVVPRVWGLFQACRIEPK